VLFDDGQDTAAGDFVAAFDAGATLQSAGEGEVADVLSEQLSGTSS